MEKEKKYKIICVKAPRWTVPFLKMFYKKDLSEKDDFVNEKENIV